VRTRVKDAICDALRDAGRPKPLPPDGPADLPLFVSCFQVPEPTPPDVAAVAALRPRMLAARCVASVQASGH
jgi:hypothetical protein